MKHLHQVLCTKTDSFTYYVIGEDRPLYQVDSSGYLNCLTTGNNIGKFVLRDNQWHLRLGDDIVDSGPASKRRWCLPEFELDTLTTLVNK